MANLEELEVLGIRIPLLELFTSSMALLLGKEPSVLMATLCADDKQLAVIINNIQTALRVQ